MEDTSNPGTVYIFTGIRLVARTLGKKKLQGIISGPSILIDAHEFLVLRKEGRRPY